MRSIACLSVGTPPIMTAQLTECNQPDVSHLRRTGLGTGVPGWRVRRLAARNRLRSTSEGRWTASSSREVSYPADANVFCFQVVEFATYIVARLPLGLLDLRAARYRLGRTSASTDRNAAYRLAGV